MRSFLSPFSYTSVMEATHGGWQGGQGPAQKFSISIFFIQWLLPVQVCASLSRREMGTGAASRRHTPQAMSPTETNQSTWLSAARGLVVAPCGGHGIYAMQHAAEISEATCRIRSYAQLSEVQKWNTFFCSFLRSQTYILFVYLTQN